MDDGLENLCEKLLATELENEEVCLETNMLTKVVNRGENCLFLQLLTKKYYNREAFRQAI